MVIQSCTSLSALTAFQPLFPQSKKSLETRRLQITQNGQGAISLPRKKFPSAMLTAACLNATCAVTQTQKQTVKGPISTSPISPLKDNLKTPMLDKGGTGFPPRGGGGGGGGGGGSGGSSSGGFYLFSLLILFDYMKELEGKESPGDNDRRFQ